MGARDLKYEIKYAINQSDEIDELTFMRLEKIIEREISKNKTKSDTIIKNLKIGLNDCIEQLPPTTDKTFFKRISKLLHL